MGDLENLRFALPIIQNAVSEDRHRLFNLADQIIDRFAVRRWDTVISDASRGVVVGEFLTHVLNAAGAHTNTTSLNHIPIANSRTVSESWESSRIHSKT